MFESSSVAAAVDEGVREVLEGGQGFIDRMAPIHTILLGTQGT